MSTESNGSFLIIFFYWLCEPILAMILVFSSISNLRINDQIWSIKHTEGKPSRCEYYQEANYLKSELG